MVMARKLSAILGLQMRATWSSSRTAIYRSEDLANQTSVMLQHYISKKNCTCNPLGNGCALTLRFQVSANHVPAAIEIGMIPDGRRTSAAARFRLKFLSFTPQRLWNRRKKFVDG
jgi:hypothetical protein